MKNKSLILSRNITINFISYFAVVLTTFFTTPYILKNLGQTYYGLLVFLSTIVNFILAFDFGFSSAFVQSLAKKIGSKEDYSSLFSTSFLFYLSLSIFWALIIFFSSHFLLEKIFPIVKQVGPLAIQGLKIFSFIFLLNALANFFSLTLKAFQKYRLANFQLISSGVITPLGTFWLLRIGGGLKEIIYFYLIINLGIAFSLFLILKSNLSLKLKKFFSWDILKNLLSFAKWKFIGQLAGQIKQKTGRFFLAFYLNLNDLPLFTIPQNLSQRYVSLLPNITAPIFTMTAQIDGEKKQKKLLDLYSTSVKLINILLLPIGVFLFFYGQDFLRLWINQDFSQKTVLILKIIITGASLFILNGLANAFLEGRGEPELPAKNSILIVSLFLIFSFILIPKFGLLGASLATCLPYLIQTPFYLVVTTKKILGRLNGQFFLDNYFWPLFLAIASAFLLNLLKLKINNWLMFLVYISLFLTIYGALIAIFKIINQKERKLIINLWKSRQLF